MKYIHSIWSNPYKKFNDDIYKEDSQGFAKKNFYHYFLSALLIKKHGYRIELFCDEESYELYSLIPYDKIHVIDFHEDGIDSRYWIWSKIKTQKLLNEPYVHIDGDVFFFNDVIKNNFPNKNKFVIQSIENEFTIKNHFHYSYLRNITNVLNNINNTEIDWFKYNLQAYNCGVVGFSDMNLKNIYISKVEEILKNMASKKNIDKYDSTILIIEQALLYYLMEEENEKPFEILKYEDIIDFNCDFDLLGSKIGYVHLWGYVKNDSDTIYKVRNKILKLFPQFEDLIHQNEIKFKLKPKNKIIEIW